MLKFPSEKPSSFTFAKWWWQLYFDFSKINTEKQSLVIPLNNSDIKEIFSVEKMSVSGLKEGEENYRILRRKARIPIKRKTHFSLPMDHFWHQMCIAFFLFFPQTKKFICLNTIWVLQSSSDTNYSELAEIPNRLRAQSHKTAPTSNANSRSQDVFSVLLTNWL